jgi:hypothetical protein
MDFSALLDDVELNSNISEPDVQSNPSRDLSGMTVKDLCSLVFAFPLLVLVQCWHLCEGLMGCLHFCSVCGFTAGSGGPGICDRISLASSSFYANVRYELLFNLKKH